MDTPDDPNGPKARAAPPPTRRGGMALTLLALVLFASPQLTGRSELGGVETATLGWIALAAGWVLLVAGIVNRARTRTGDQKV